MSIMENNWLILLNPAAAGGKASREWPKIEKSLNENQFSYTVYKTERKGHAIELVQKGIQEGYRKIIAIGGDGTNNEVVNGIFGQEEVSPGGILYTLIPIGTGNDWRRTYNIPSDYKKWIPLIKNLKTKKQDIGLVHYHDEEGNKHKRYFVNVAGMAYDGYIGKLTSHKKTVSKFIYLYLVITQLFNYKNRKAAVIFNNEEVEAPFYSVNLGICKYSGGGMQLVPHAIPDDGLMALTYDTGLSKFQIVTMTPRLFTGTITKHKKIFAHQVTHARVEAREDRPTYLEVDGEFLGQTPCEFYILNRVLNVIVP